MNKKELEEILKICKQQIDIFQNQLKDIEQQMRGMEKQDGEKVWQPKEKGQYWVIATDGQVWPTYNDGDKGIIEYGNCFKTREEAEKQAEYNRVMNRFRKYVEAYSEPLDWENAYRSKYKLIYDYSTHQIDIDTNEVMDVAFALYASSKQVLKDAIIYSAGSEEEFIRIVFGVNNE